MFFQFRAMLEIEKTSPFPGGLSRNIVSNHRDAPTGRLYDFWSMNVGGVLRSISGPEAPPPWGGGMNEQQAMVRLIRQHGVRDQRVLAAMAKVPRRAFVLVRDREQAYANGALPIAAGQTISQPYIVALMSESLAL